MHTLSLRSLIYDVCLFRKSFMQRLIVTGTHLNAVSAF